MILLRSRHASPDTYDPAIRARYEAAIRAYGYDPEVYLGAGAHCAAFRALGLDGSVTCKVPLSDDDPSTVRDVPYARRVRHLRNESLVLGQMCGVKGIAQRLCFQDRGLAYPTGSLNALTGGRFSRRPHVMLVLDFVPGRTLDPGERLTNDAQRSMLHASVMALHRNGYANLDLKETNIIVRDDGAWLIDLGYVCHERSVDPGFYASRVRRDRYRLERYAG